MAEPQCNRRDVCNGRPGDLEGHRNLIKKLYVDEDLPLRTVMDLLNDSHRISASLNMYKKKLRQWKLRKSDNNHELVVLVCRNADQKEPKNSFRVRGRKIPGLEVQKFLKWQNMHPAYLSLPLEDQISPRKAEQTAYDFSSGASTSSRSGDGTSIEERESLSISPVSSGGCDYKLPLTISDDNTTSEPSPPYWYISDARPKFVRHDCLASVVNTSLENQSLKFIDCPASLRISEEMLFAMRTHVVRRLEPRLISVDEEDPTHKLGSRLTPVSKRRRLTWPGIASEFNLAIVNALVTLQKFGVARTTASLEQAFRHIQALLQNDSFAVMLFFLEALVHTQIYGAPQVGRILLQHIYQMATVIFSEHHPYAIWARNLLILYDTEGALEAAVARFCDAVEDALGPDDPMVPNQKGVLYDLQFKLRYHKNPSEDPSELINKYNAILGTCLARGDRAHQRLHMNLSAGLAGIYESLGQWHEAEIVYSNAPSQLERVMTDLSHGEEEPWFIPLGAIRSTAMLAQDIAQQSRFEEASQIFEKALNAATQVLGPDHPSTITIIADFAKCLAELNLDDHAKQMYDVLDERLKPFTLSPEMEIRF